jgi:hypothetical protein
LATTNTYPPDNVLKLIQLTIQRYTRHLTGWKKCNDFLGFHWYHQPTQFISQCKAYLRRDVIGKVSKRRNKKLTNICFFVIPNVRNWYQQK